MGKVSCSTRAFDGARIHDWSILRYNHLQHKPPQELTFNQNFVTAMILTCRSLRRWPTDWSSIN